VNAVGWLRSAQPLDHAGLVLAETRAVPRHVTRAAFARILRRAGFVALAARIWPGSACAACAEPTQPACQACLDPVYIYRVERPFPRAFVLDTSDAIEPGGALVPLLQREEELARRLAASGVVAAPLERRGPGDLRLEGDVGGDRLVVVSENAAPGWRLSIDGREDATRLAAPLFGMLTFRAAAGAHAYRLWYDDGTNRRVLVGLALGTLALVGLCLAQDRIETRA
jgi:hypothetical protein